MVIRNSTLLAALLAFCCSYAGAQPSASAPADLRTTTDWAGGNLAYPIGNAEISSVILRIEKGDSPPFHCHPVPTMGYVLRGEIEVETADGRKRVMRAGESVVEVMRTVHRGVALKAPVEIIVFYAGAEGIPNTVLPADDPEGRYCERL